MGMREWLRAAGYIYIWVWAVITLFIRSEHGDLRLADSNIAGLYALDIVAPALIFILYQRVLWPMRWLARQGWRIYRGHKEPGP
jgi:hypothetical protein